MTTSVDLLLTEVGRLTIEVGRIDFLALPIRKQDDFSCIPPSIVSLADARAISLELAQQVGKGRIGRYEWRKSQ
jgi:hypothetical protein